MKTKFTALLFVLTSAGIAATAQNTFPAMGPAGIGTTKPDVSSLLEIKSTAKGLLIPRMTKTQRDAIAVPPAVPATGLLIYQTNSTPGFYYYNGNAWTAVTPKSKGWSLTGNAGTNPATNFIGTTDAQPLVFKVNNQKAGLIDHNAATANTGYGYQSLLINTTGVQNTATGFSAMHSNTIGNYNTANGYQALYSNTAGTANTAFGIAALYSNTTASYNTANGNVALYSNTTGNGNTANGNGALFSNTTGNGNTASGRAALLSNTTGSANVAIGVGSLYSNTDHSNLVAVGDSALFNNGIGASQGVFATANTAVGSKALFSNTTGNDNTANGYQALYSNTTGHENIANGVQALYSNTTGYANITNGCVALFNNITGNFNTANGGLALFNNTTGNLNTADGYDALHFNITGNNNTALGYVADVLHSDLTNATALGYNAVVDASNKVRVGNTDVSSIGGKVSWTSFSDGRYKKNIKTDVQGLKFINLLKPITYTVDINALDNYYSKNRKHDSAFAKMKEQMKPEADKAAKIIYNGFIAQDVEKAAQSLNYNFSGVDKPQTEDGLYGLRYSDFVVPLVKAVQELSQKNDSLKKRNDEMEARLEKLETIVFAGQLQSQLNNTSQTVELTAIPRLEQNIPNPFNKNTIIKYYLLSKSNNAQLVITDTKGHTLKSISISNKGAGQATISANTLSSGNYFYSLIIDGKKIDTKQMILTK